MNDIERRLQSWKNYDEAREAERQKIAFLRQPPAKNPEYLTRLVRVKVLKGFFDAKGVARTPGETCFVSFATARDLVARQRATLVEG